jgi:hypothetical protein
VRFDYYESSIAQLAIEVSIIHKNLEAIQQDVLMYKSCVVIVNFRGRALW